MSDPAYFLTEAKRCRRLARGMDERTAKALLEMAAEHERQARLIELAEVREIEQWQNE